METLKHIAIGVVVFFLVCWLVKKKGCGCGCSSAKGAAAAPGQQSHPKADDRRPASSPGGVRAQQAPGCVPFATCGR